MHTLDFAEQVRGGGKLKRQPLIHLDEFVLDAADVFPRLLLIGIQLFLAAFLRKGREASLHLFQRGDFVLDHVLRGQDGLHLLAQARSLQYAALIDGFQHDGIELVRPGQREQALGGFLHAGKALAERIDDRLEAPGQAVDLDFHRVQLILILLERLFPHGVVGGGGLAFLLGGFGFRLKFGRRGFGVLPSPFLGLLLALASARPWLWLRPPGGPFPRLPVWPSLRFEFGFFLVRQGVFVGGRVSRFVRFGLFFFSGRFLVGRGGASLSGAASRGRAERLAHRSPAIMNRAKRPNVERVKKCCRDMVFYPLSTRKDVPVSYGKASGHARPFSLLIKRMGRFRAVWRRPSRREAVRARCRLVALGNVRKEEWGRRFDEKIDITIL